MTGRSLAAVGARQDKSDIAPLVKGTGAAATCALLMAAALTVCGSAALRAEEPGVPGAAEAAVLELQGLPGVEALDDSEIGGITVGADDRLSNAARRGPIVRGEPVQALDYSANRLGAASPLGFAGPAAQNPAAGPSAAGAINAFSPF